MVCVCSKRRICVVEAHVIMHTRLAQAMAYMISSLAKFGHMDAALLEGVLDALDAAPGRFDVLDWENLLMAVARLGSSPARILQAVDAAVRLCCDEWIYKEDQMCTDAHCMHSWISGALRASHHPQACWH